MEILLTDVYRIADLARVEIQTDEAQAALEQLSNIFNLIEQMQAVDTAEIEPMSHAQDMKLRLRQDIVSEADRHELFQSIAPQVEAGLYLVPKVIE
ncbi:MAG TPA: Asp-tRNA(Asn)/Glu-tRNA(Gln) amidotransferase subunit GatC [Nitrosomonas sp.]|nr:Asp-tRNA(Asn)/Glu-tRNA(Gln) amidotransferase subunit GatC [Nitrosomonas sp.]HMW20526.1 Asp-tRNA(Asn)/Glu-tRNA(Gln) amidotransferase subunit GatC [Nitrosomonas sp.]HMW68324.1 Asp-tRNA(Asn)/Glu-tRNA(Gln) amidotransferase subunit GatC [Nitrosomonas sp.]HMY61045.1 Asp-tRNA(Asn)/Glu-tRNA(Gln) amidotransferase subunit GatC [Nitrosomonas sp.]HMY89466.1 Asp-tRNA(Asn)/Glu-tRNA(Gln) amidotransferase subunit GatC [Nitrosomonas sp.]